MSTRENIRLIARAPLDIINTETRPSLAKQKMMLKDIRPGPCEYYNKSTMYEIAISLYLTFHIIEGLDGGVVLVFTIH